MPAASPRIAAAVAALPVRAGMRVLELGCGPGAAARELLRLHPGVYVLGIDRSATAIHQAISACKAEVAQGRLDFRCAAAEEFGSTQAISALISRLRSASALSTGGTRKPQRRLFAELRQQ